MTQHQVEALAKSHSIPSDGKLEKRRLLIERMRRFYESKIPIAPEPQAELFKDFVEALNYADTIIVMYRKLTQELAGLAEEGPE